MVPADSTGVWSGVFLAVSHLTEGEAEASENYFVTLKTNLQHKIGITHGQWENSRRD